MIVVWFTNVYPYPRIIVFGGVREVLVLTKLVFAGRSPTRLSWIPTLIIGAERAKEVVHVRSRN